MKRSLIIETARAYKGVPFHHQGRCRSGIDCIGLVIVVAKDLGLDTSRDIPDYPRRPDGRMLSILSEVCRPADPPHPGDILLFRIRSDGADHAGILTGENSLIHAWGPAGANSVVETDIPASLQKRLVCALEFPGVDPWQ